MRFLEFFEGENGQLSMMRLTMFLSFWPASYIIVTKGTETMLGLYLGAYVVGYIGGKGLDAAMAPKQSKVSDVDSGSVSADIAVSVNQPLATPSGKAGRGKKRT